MEQKFAALFGDEFVKDGQLNLAEFAAKKGYGLDLEFEVSCAYEDQRDREKIEVEQGQIKRFVRDWVLAGP
jgi:NOL1/NOP2/fmu family ribosome biogenesis protein